MKTETLLDELIEKYMVTGEKGQQLQSCLDLNIDTIKTETEITLSISELKGCLSEFNKKQGGEYKLISDKLTILENILSTMEETK